MASASAGNVGRHLGRLFDAGSAVGLTDGELLERFAGRRDESAEAAFEILLARHGALVLTVCHQVLGDAAAAEDAFQATFLVLLRRAGSMRVREPGTLGPWLHGVAYRIALKARQGAGRRRARECRVAVPAVATPSAVVEQVELQAMLHDEVNRLPAKYRAPVVLCYFEGRTHDEAAAALGWPVGTVRGRLARARDRLRDRLTRRGLAPGGWIGASLLEPAVRIEPPARLLEATVAAAIKGMPAASVGAMANLMLRRLLLARVGMTAAVLSIAAMTAGFGLALRGAPAPLGRQRSEATTKTSSPSRPVDRRADPLPRYARLRIGGTRFDHGDSIHQVLYTPNGKSLVAIDRTGAVCVWDAASGQLVRNIGSPFTDLGQIALSPDGRALATIEASGQLSVWDLASGRERRRWHAIPGAGRHLAFSPDGRTVAAALSTLDQGNNRKKHAIILWDIDSPTEHRRRFAADWRDLWDLAFTPDGKGLVTVSTDTESRIVGERPEKGSARLWDVATGRERRRFPIEGFDVRSVAVSPDGRLVAAGVSDQTIRLYDLATGRERTPALGQERALRPDPRRGADRPGPGNRDFFVMKCLAFSPDGSILASGCCGTGNTGSSRLADIYLWDVARAAELRHFPAQQGWISSLGFAPDGRTLASTGPEPMIRLWDVATGREVLPQSGHRSAIRNMVISPADGTIFTAGQDGTIRHWDTATGRELGIVARFETAADAMAISPDGKTLLVGGSLGGRFALWSIAERREIRSLPRVEPRNPVHYFAFSPDGKAVASERRIWDVATGRVLATFRDRDEQNNRDANFFPVFYSPDGQQLITAENGGIRIWDIASGEARWAVRARINFQVAALSPDGRYLATRGLVARTAGIEENPAIRVWDLASGREVATLKGHTTSTHGLAFSADGRWLASCSGDSRTGDDATVRIWDVATGRELRRLLGHLGPVNAVAFTPDGRSIVSGSADATALVWDISDLTDRPPIPTLRIPFGRNYRP